MDGHRSEVVTLAFLDVEGQRVFVGRVVEGGIGRDDAHVGVAAIVIELAQRFFVGVELVFVVDILASQERQEVRTLGGDDGSQAAGAVGIVTDEVDRIDLGAVALVDDEARLTRPSPSGTTCVVTSTSLRPVAA